MTDQEKLTYLCRTLNKDATHTTTQTILIGDRTIFFNSEGEVRKIEFQTPNGKEVVYP